MKKIFSIALSLILVFSLSSGNVFATGNLNMSPTPSVKTVQSVKLSKTKHTYSGKEKRPSIIATDSEGNIIPNDCYTVTYKKNIVLGTAKAVIKFKNGFEGTKTLSFKIYPKKAGKPSLSQRKQKQLTVTVKEDTSVSGYQIRYSTSSKFKKSKTIDLTRSKGLVKTILKLKNGKKYYVSVRGYKTLSSGKRLYGEWSKTASKTVSSASAHAELPDEMLDSFVLDSMRYVGYKVDKHSKLGSLMQDRASGPRTPYSVRSGIRYNGAPNGMEKVKDSSTVSGYAPDLDYFKRTGLVCASYVSYYYLNYLPNIAGVDTSYIKNAIKKSGASPRTCESWAWAAKYLVKKGKAKVIDRSSSSLRGATLSKLEIGDLICFSVPNQGVSCGHVAVYAGENNEGDHFVTHVGSDEGPVFQTLERFENVVHQYDGCAYSVVYRFKDLPNSRFDYQVSLKKTSLKYTGKELTPKVIVKDAGGKKIPSKYYTLHYNNNKKVGTAKVTVVFKGKYQGAKTLKFKIKK